MRSYYFEKSQRYLSDALVRLGLKEGKNSYQKFVILSEYRSGSNLIMNLLKSHPNVVCFSEVFFPKQLFWGNWIYGKGETDQSIMAERSDNQAFLDKYIFRKYAKSIDAVCFKLMTGDIFEYKTFNFDLFLKHFPNTKIIFLNRENLFHRKVSHHLGGLTKTRVIRDENKWKKQLNSISKFSLTYEDCLQEFESVNNSRMILSDRLANSSVEVMELTYEKLVKNRAVILPQILEWLNLSPFDLSTNQKKQNKKSMRDWLENYDDLKQNFHGSKWEHFFDE